MQRRNKDRGQGTATS